MIGTDREVVLMRSERIVEKKAASVRVWSGVDGGQRIKSQIGCDCGVHCDLCVACARIGARGYTETSRAGCGGRDDAGGVGALKLAKAFVVAE